MSDVAQVLGGMGKPKSTGPPKPPPPLPPGHHPTRAIQMTGGIPKEVMDLVGGGQDPKSAALPPIVPAFSGGGSASADPTVAITKTTTVKVGNKWINTQKPARKWVWASFASSARTDGLLLNHWVRHGIDYPDYPYAKFDIHLDPVTYASEQEYRDKLQDENWTKSETDQLLELARKYELRWPVIYDRWLEMFHYRVVEDDPKNAPRIVSRKVEDLQYRYYSVAAILTQHRIAQEAAAEAQALAGSVPDPAIENPKAVADALLRDTAAARTVAAGDPKHQPLIHNLGTGTTNKVFDVTYEKERRAHLELLWHRTKEEEEEEIALRKELRLVDTQIRKLKKSGGHIITANDAKSGSGKTRSTPAPGAAAASAGASASGGAGSSSREASRSASPANAAEVVLAPGALMDQSFASTAPAPTPGTPYLQSGRLAHPATGGAMGLNKTLLGRMDAVLADLKIGPRPIPTKRVCDTYDSVRKDILTLLTLRKMVLQKEGQLQSKRVKLSRMGGKIQVADEETALGIPKPQPLPPPVPTTTAVNTASAAAPVAAAPSTTVKPKAPRTGGKGKTATTATGGKAKAAAASATAAAQGADPTKGKATDAKTKSGATSAAAKQPAVAGKQAAAKQGGGKQAKKPAAKRKRKSVAAEAKSHAPSSSASAATIAQAQAAAGYVPPTAAATPEAARPPTAVPPTPVSAALPPTAGAVQPAPVAAAVAPAAIPAAALAPAPATSTKKRARKS